MNTVAEPFADSVPEPQAVARTPARPVRPLYWSVRRELWESRSIYLSPLIAAGIFLFGFMVSARRLAPLVRRINAHDLAGQGSGYLLPYYFAAIVIMITSLVVAVFYCLGALHNERRDRSILFWKSLPVSDLTTVLSKAAIPLVALPVITFAITVVTQLIILALGTAILAAAGLDAHDLSQFSILSESGGLFYGLLALTLWHAPVYGWLLLVSAWARRAPFLWAFGVPIAATLFETVAFGTSVVGSFFWNRLMGGFDEAFVTRGAGSGVVMQPHIDAVRFFSNPDLWLGLAVAAGFIGACVWLRRYRDPV